MTMEQWLEQAAQSGLTEEAEGYLLGRGATDQDILDYAYFVWSPPSTPAPDPGFAAKYLPYGERWAGLLVCLIRGPDGAITGAKAKGLHQKLSLVYRVPSQPWSIFLWGCDHATVRAWGGGAVWVTEGDFDALALGWCIPKTDGRVALQTARLSESHVEHFRRLGCHVHLVLDMDRAGREGTARAVKAFEAVGVPYTPWKYLGGKDPGEIWDKQGAEGLRAAFDMGV